MSGDMFVYYDLVGDGGRDGIWRVEAGGAAKHCTLHSAAATTKKLIWPQNVNSAKGFGICPYVIATIFLFI